MAVPDAGPRPNSRKNARFFVSLACLNWDETLAPIIPHPFRNCGSLPPKSLTRLAPSRVALRSVAGVVYVEPFREIRPGAACRCGGRRQSGHHDGSPGPSPDNSGGSRRASTPGRRRQLPVGAEGCDPLGQPLVLSHRPHDQTSVLVSPGGERYGRRQIRPRRAASFGPGASFRYSASFSNSSFSNGGAGAATNDYTQIDRRRTCRVGLPATPHRAKSDRQSRATNGWGRPRSSGAEQPARRYTERTRTGAAVVDAME